MSILKRNHRQVLSAKAINNRRTRFSIDGVPGLCLDVRPKGARTWYVRYQFGRNGNRKFRFYRIGDASTILLGEAIERAKQVRRTVELDKIDIFAIERRVEPTALSFNDLFDAWYQRHALPRLARPGDDKGKFDRHLKDAIGKRSVDQIARTDIAGIRDEIAAKSGPVISNHIVALFNRVMNWAVEEGLIASNPAVRLRKVGDMKPRERVLSDSEIKLFWHALTRMDAMTGEHIARGEKGKTLSPSTRTILKLMLLTGQRRGELTGATIGEFDLSASNPIWMIPGERTKNGLLHRVPLCPMAKSLIEQAIHLRSKTGNFVFPSPETSEASILPEAVTRAMARLIAELGMDVKSPHDLRRTVGTELAKLGISENIRALILNHSPRSRGITDSVYNRYAYDREKREALLAWESRLSQLISYG